MKNIIHIATLVLLSAIVARSNGSRKGTLFKVKKPAVAPAHPREYSFLIKAAMTGTIEYAGKNVENTNK